MRLHKPIPFDGHEHEVWRSLGEECHAWKNSVDLWKRMSEHIVSCCSEVSASPVVTSDVAKTAGELSLFAEHLQMLSSKIELHVSCMLISAADNDDESAWMQEHQLLQRNMNESAVQYRTLLWKLFRLEESAYRKFIT